MKYSEKYRQALRDAQDEEERVKKKYKDLKEDSISPHEANKRKLELLGIQVKVKELRQKFFRARSLENDGVDSGAVEGVRTL